MHGKQNKNQKITALPIAILLLGFVVPAVLCFRFRPLACPWLGIGFLRLKTIYDAQIIIIIF
jgi:hypothetical protein